MKQWQIVALALLAVVSLYFYGQQVDGAEEYESWKVDFGKNFDRNEEPFRKIIFLNNLKEIKEHNSDPKQTFLKGTNQFSHLTQSEFEQMFLSTVYKTEGHLISNLNQKEEHVVEPLREIDWQALGKVSAVKDQGICDAGYAFCSASLIESFYLFSNKNLSLSEQQIIDCSADYTTFGCQGGSRNGTLIYIRQKGLSTSAAYPYKGVKNNCQKESGEYKPNYTHVQFNGCDGILNNLYHAPMTVAVNAKDWRNYKSGIFNACTSTEVNHDTYLVGANTGYWRIKNSWGLRWGEYGFIRMKSGNTCGICQKPGFSFKA